MRFKRKIPSFVFGLSLGLLIGIAFFLFKLDAIFSKMRIAAGSDKVTVIEHKIGDKELERRKRDKERFKIKTNDNDSTRNFNESYNQADSSQTLSDTERLNIAVDELLSSRSIKIISLTENNNGDSLATLAAGVRYNQPPESFQLEFWRTPLNSKGYRFYKNKIMLYGLNDHANIMLYQLNGKYFIKSFEMVYELKNNQDFQPLIRVNNSELLAKLDS